MVFGVLISLQRQRSILFPDLCSKDCDFCSLTIGGGASFVKSIKKASNRLRPGGTLCMMPKYVDAIEGRLKFCSTSSVIGLCNRKGSDLTSCRALWQLSTTKGLRSGRARSLQSRDEANEFVHIGCEVLLAFVIFFIVHSVDAYSIVVPLIVFQSPVYFGGVILPGGVVQRLEEGTQENKRAHDAVNYKHAA